MDEKELQEKFFWTANAMERKMLLDANLPQFSSATYAQKIKDYDKLFGEIWSTSMRVTNLEMEKKHK